MASLATLAVSAVVLAGVSLVLSLRATRIATAPAPASSQELYAHVQALRTSVIDLTDRVEQWQKRDRVRRTRESHEGVEAAPPMDPVSLKAEVRRRALGMT